MTRVALLLLAVVLTGCAAPAPQAPVPGTLPPVATPDEPGPVEATPPAPTYDAAFLQPTPSGRASGSPEARWRTVVISDLWDARADGNGSLEGPEADKDARVPILPMGGRDRIRLEIYKSPHANFTDFRAEILLPRGLQVVAGNATYAGPLTTDALVLTVVVEAVEPGEWKVLTLAKLEDETIPAEDALSYRVR